MDGRTISGKIQNTAGGVGRNVADCMARLGSDPLFISLLGAQEYSETLLCKMNHMNKKGITVLQDARTATCVVVLYENGECAFDVGDMSIHDKLQPEQVEMHEHTIAAAPVVVVDGNILPSTMNYIMNLCTKHRVPVWFEPTDINRAARPLQGREWRSAIAYASPNLNELTVMHDTLFSKATPPLEDDSLERKLEESLRLGIPLITDKLHTLVVTLASHGILLITRLPSDEPFPTGQTSPNMGKIRAVHYPAIVPKDIISVSGAGDCFAAAMISAMLRGLSPDACINAGQRAAILSLSSHNAVPSSMCPDAVFTASTSKLRIKPITVL